MGSAEAMLWLAPALVLLGGAWLWLKRATSPRVRPRERKRFPRAQQLNWDLVQGAEALSSSMPPTVAESIRREAEETARRIAGSRGPEPANPYPRGTREFVLWTTSFHAALAEHAERRMRPSAPTPL